MMDLKYIAAFFTLLLLPGLSAATPIFNQTYTLTSNSYYSYMYYPLDSNGYQSATPVIDTSTLSGTLNVTADMGTTCCNITVTIDYSNVLLNGSPLLPNDILSTDIPSFYSMSLTANDTNNNGNAQLTTPHIPSYGCAQCTLCVECSYDMILNMDAAPGGNPLALSYSEYNPYGDGQSSYKLYVASVPLPASILLLISGFLGLFGFSNRKRRSSQ